MSTPNAGESREAPMLSDQDLVAGFEQGEVSGQEVMRRLLDKAGLGHRRQETLLRRDGSTLTDDDGNPLTAEDYLAIADKHPSASQVILNFVAMDEQDPTFPAAREAIAFIVSGYLPPDTPDAG